MFAEIIFPIRSFRTFTYRIPKQLIHKISTGSSVYAKINNKLASGYVVEISKKCGREKTLFATINPPAIRCSPPRDPHASAGGRALGGQPKPGRLA